MKTNIHYLVIAVIVFTIGLSLGKHSRPLTHENQEIKTRPLSERINCLLAGGTRGTPGGRDVVFLPGIRMVFREEDWQESAWLPVASIQEIGEQEKVVAVMMRSSLNDDGWVVFDSQRAVLLPRTEIAHMLTNRFLPLLDPAKLSYASKRK